MGVTILWTLAVIGGLAVLGLVCNMFAPEVEEEEEE